MEKSLLNPEFTKYADGLIPVVIQDWQTLRVLMLGFMNEDAYAKTLAESRVTFFSRSKQRLWTKGETSGNFLNVKEVLLDCDKDTLLIKVEPMGPVCHTGAETCFNEKNNSSDFIKHLEAVIASRATGNQPESYTYKLLSGDPSRIAQKVGEEGLEVALEAMKINQPKLLEESADLVYHLLVLLHKFNKSFNDVIETLKQRENKS
jgi:phosphoribosyl-ATP pyrophosphohydrolase/phosphoribosyl-AMP cyclohydrolase